MTVSGQRSPSADGSGEVWSVAATAFGRWLDGDAAGLEDLVGVMTPVLWQVVRAYRLDAELAEDVVQTTWLALVRRRDAIEQPVAVGAWLTTTARREAWRVARRTQRDVPVDDERLCAIQGDERVAGTVAAGTSASAETEALAHDEQAVLWRAVSTLPDRCQRLLRVVAFDERPDYSRIAADLGMPVGSIGPTRGRCLAKLRQALVTSGALEGVSAGGEQR